MFFFFLEYRSYIKRGTAQFFGVDEETEAREKQKWLDRRRRMATRKYGALVPEHRPPDPDITRDVPDTTEIPEVSALCRAILIRDYARIDDDRRYRGNHRRANFIMYPPVILHSNELVRSASASLEKLFPSVIPI